MTSFVLENAKQPYVEGTKYKDLVNYAKFLKQPLKLEMFVTCDDDGNVLKEPKKTNYQVDVNTKCSGWKYLYDNNDKLIGYYDDRKWKEDFVKYKQSKEKVLFEGFNLNQKDFSKLESIFCLTKECFQITFFTKEKGCFMDNLKTNKTYEIKTIEDLIQFKLELTESAIKQIGL